MVDHRCNRFCDMMKLKGTLSCVILCYWRKELLANLGWIILHPKVASIPPSSFTDVWEECPSWKARVFLEAVPERNVVNVATMSSKHLTVLDGFFLNRCAFHHVL